MSTETAAFRRYAAAPKTPCGQKRTAFLPVLPADQLSWAIGDLAPAERDAMRRIVEAIDLLVIDGQKFILAPVDDRTLDVLASFDAEIEDREPVLDDEADELDDADADEDIGDMEPDFEKERAPLVRARKAEKQTRRVIPTDNPRVQHIVYGYDDTHDEAERERAWWFAHGDRAARSASR